MTTMFWSRKGEPMDTTEWAMAYEDPEQRVVAVDTDGSTDMVSTIWEGLCRPLPEREQETPVGIFETAWVVNGHVEDAWRTDTEEGAMIMHQAVCLKVLGRRARPEDGWREKAIEKSRRKRNIKED